MLVAAAVAVRLWAVPPQLPDLDAVNFARGLARFDVAAQAPHFPGYPVYVALARGAAALGAPEVLALALPGVVLAGLAVLALARALRPHVGGGAALAGAGLLALLPLPVLAGGAPASDGAGVAALALALAAVLRLGGAAASAAAGDGTRAALAAGALAGLTLGVRPSFLPAVAGLLLVVPAGARRAWALGLAAAAAVWAAGLALATGPSALMAVAGRFLAGHAGEWGGTVAVEPDLARRASLFLFDVLAAGLGTPWAGAVTPARVALGAGLLAALGLGARALARGELEAGPRRVALAALALGAPYAAWMFVGQNLLKARHALPLVLAAAVLVAAACAARAAAARAAPAALALLAALVTLPLAHAQGTTPAPAAALVAHARAHLPPGRALLLTGEEARLFEHLAPWLRAGRPADAAALRAAAERYARAGVDVYVTSSAPGATALSAQLTPVASFTCDRLVRSHGHTLVLSRFHPAAQAPLAARAEEVR